MASVLKGQSGQPIQFETVPNVNGDDVATESAISTPNNALIKSALNAGGDAPVYACRAWVNFRGNSDPAVVRASGNVSSVVRNTVGDYTVNFLEGLEDNFYTVSGSGQRSIDDTSLVFSIYGSSTYDLTPNSVRVIFKDVSGNLRPCLIGCVSVFR